ncbi:MAG: type VI secretion system baseplate subunit TssK [Gemmatimonadota bacterium]|jgi:type VI secretion system protein ImpJ
MRQMQPVLWTKGLLLSPQHLQTQDRFLEDQIRFRVGSMSFRPWGFTRLELDQEALDGGVLALTDAAGILPDGLPFDIPAADSAPEPKPLAEHWEQDQQTMDVHLAIPEHRPGEQNVSTGSGRTTRWVAEVSLLRDANTGTTEKPVQLGRKNFRLLTESESLEGASFLPVARVRRSETGALQLDPRYVPPVLDFSANDYLVSIARRLLEVLSARSGDLSRNRRERNRSLADFGISDVANFWLLYTVNTHLPLFRHLLEVRRGHPARLFEAMLALAGTLTTFSDTRSPADFPEYDHDDLGGCFTALDETLRELLGTVVPESHVSLPLTPAGPSVYATAIDQDSYLDAPQWYLALRADMDQAELLRKAGQLKVSSGDRIDTLFRKALSGLPIRHMPRPPSSIPVKLDCHYFMLDRKGEEWDAIRQGRNLAVWAPGDLPSPSLELVIVLPKKGR